MLLWSWELSCDSPMGLCVVGRMMTQGHIRCHHSRLSAGFSIARWTVGTWSVLQPRPQAPVPSLAPIPFRSQMLLCVTASKRSPRPSSHVEYATGNANPEDGSPGLTAGSNMRDPSSSHTCPDIWMHWRSHSELRVIAKLTEASVGVAGKMSGGDIYANHGTTKRGA